MHIDQRKSLIQAAKNGEATRILKNARMINVFTSEVIAGDIALYHDRILGVGHGYHAPDETNLDGAYVCPGFIDAHIHIESSMSLPANYARSVLPHGTTTIIADPHEIANVCGMDGIRFFLEQTEDLPLRVYFMMPSCVPCTAFETSGAILDAEVLLPFQSHPRILGLGEMMDYHAVVAGDETVLKKLDAFQHMPIDGHAPLLSGNALHAYRIGGAFSDHECSSYEEVLEKLRQGMLIQLRMGSAAHGIESIFRRIAYEDLPTQNLSFCTDDKQLENIHREGHINYILRCAVAAGINPLSAIQMATCNTARAYGLRDIGAIAPGYIADLVVLPNLESFRPQSVIIKGRDYVDKPIPVAPIPECIRQSVHLQARSPDMLVLRVSGHMPVIELIPGQIVTKLRLREVPADNGAFVSGSGLCKVAVIERHHATGKYGLGILSGLGIRDGAIASTVAHDSHNLIVAGDNDGDMFAAIDALEECGGGYVVTSKGRVQALLPLPIGGLMTDLPPDQLLSAQQHLLAQACALGMTDIPDPFITLSFLALPVIPEGRVTDQGVFQVSAQRFINI